MPATSAVLIAFFSSFFAAAINSTNEANKAASSTIKQSIYLDVYGHKWRSIKVLWHYHQLDRNASIALVIHPRNGVNDKELSVIKGEYLEVSQVRLWANQDYG